MVDPAVKLDGGDVLFTGREILVGLSSRTNKAGVEAVQAAFPGFPVTGIEVAGPLHLKTLLTLCGEDTLCASIENGDSFTMLKVSFVRLYRFDADSFVGDERVSICVRERIECMYVRERRVKMCECSCETKVIWRKGRRLILSSNSCFYAENV